MPTPTSSEPIVAKDVLKSASLILNVCVMLVISILAWVGSNMNANITVLIAANHAVDKRVTAIEANRFDAGDWAEAQKCWSENAIKTQEELHRLWRELSKYPLKTELPNQLIEEKLDALQDRIRGAEESIRILESRTKGG